jgi:5'-3' exonuclease
MAAHYAERGVRVSILSGDGDVLQLLRPGVEVILMKKGFSNYDTVREEQLSEYKGLRHAAQIIELKALMGDSSDFIPGCPNVGPKTALKLLQEHGDVAGVFAAAEQLPVKLRDNLLAHRAQIELSRELATIRCDVPFACVLDQSALGWDDAVMKQTLTELGMKPQSK